MTVALYMDDSYLKEFSAKVISIKDDKFVVLDKTAFYPTGGGQPHDTGKLIKDGKEYNVVFVGKFDGNISHEVDSPGLKPGDEVKGLIDWDRRYAFMRMHTASHLVSAIISRESNAKITGNQIGLDKTRIDYNVENFDRDQFEKYIEMVNDEINKDHEVTTEFIKLEDAKKDPTLFKLAMGFPHDIEEIRLVSIGDVDKQADGGTHVKKTKEIGNIFLESCKNKGKGNRRIYFAFK